MKKTIFQKRLISFIACLILVFSLAVSASARTLVDTSKKGTLDLSYKYNDIVFEGIEISIYHVANLTVGGTFELNDTFSKYPINVSNVQTQSEWNKIASTLDAYVEVENLVPTANVKTNAEGVASFTDLTIGLYLVIGCRAEYDEGYCDYNTFLISVPGLDAGDNWVYDVAAKPKVSHHEVTGRDIEYTVNKMWKDSGFEEKRPDKVAVDIFKNGEKVETVYLTSENNWSYTWKAKDDGSKWNTIENLVPEGYYVTFETNGNTFIITNVFEGDDPPPPTGDSSNLYFAMVILCIVGTVLIVVGLGKSRRRIR